MTDLSQIAEPDWNEAHRRARVLRPLAELAHCPRDQVSAAAAELGLSERHTYRLIQRLRAADGALTALRVGRSGGGRGRRRLAGAREDLMRGLIEELYLTPQKRLAAEVVRAIRQRSLQQGLHPPSESTIRRRLNALSLAERGRRGESHPEAQPIDGATPPAAGPLDWVQIDHTPVDVIIVDPIDRLPIGRPWLTVAIDVFSRCLAGFHLSLDAPSATGVGLCLTLVASDKAPWLRQRGIEAHWPVVGKPRRLGVDNAAEFHSAAFERGYAQHGIAIEWRPPGQPHFGGIVERVIGTLMQLVHTLPGTTFANPIARGGYDSDRTACLTLEDLERWLAVAITQYYHRRPHGGLADETPLHRYEQGLRALAAAGKTVPAPREPRAFLIDFLPVVRRSLQRNGLTIDHITYYNPALRTWIRQRKPAGPLLIRRDPRDLSRIFVLDADQNAYLEVPYRMLSRPAITLWEHKLACQRLRAQRRAAVDEASLFAAIEEMRAIEREAATLTRTARRNRTRRAVGPATARAPEAPSVAPTGSAPVRIDASPVRPFDDIESW